MYDLVNSWSAAQQLLSDLYVTWPLILLMSVGALRKFLIHKNVNSNTGLKSICLRSVINCYHRINALANSFDIMVDLHICCNCQYCNHCNLMDDLLQHQT